MKMTYVAGKDNKTGIEIKNTDGDVIFKSSKTTIKEAVEEAVANRANLYGANLRETDLRGANLRGADLIEANLYEANLYGANLYEANLYGANLYEANLSEANLYGANLYEANLSEANLSEAELQNAKFYGKGGTSKLKRSQVPDFLAALGFVIEDQLNK